MVESNIHIIGCGGIGSWLVPAMVKLVTSNPLILWDGDTLEEKNLDRQLFTVDDIGTNKAAALGLRSGCQWEVKYFAAGLREFGDEEWFLVGVDNHPARRAVLEECDRYGCRAILAANETHSAEAYYYQPAWKGTKLDPRVYYPEIVSDRSGDPRAAAIGCTGEAQVLNPQLVTSNALAAALAGHLFALWALKAPKLERDTLASLPFKLSATMTRMESFTVESVR